MTPQLKDGKTSIPEETIDSIKRNKVALKGPLAVRTPPFHDKVNADDQTIDTYWQRSRLPQSNSPTNIQPLRKRTTM